MGEIGPGVTAFPGPPFEVPAGAAATAGDFDASGYAFWAVLPPGGAAAGKSAVQELGLALSAVPCANGLLAVRCSMVARRA